LYFSRSAELWCKAATWATRVCVLHSIGDLRSPLVERTRLVFSRAKFLRQSCLALLNHLSSRCSQRAWFHLLGPRLSAGRFSRLVERRQRACQIWLEPPCRVALSISPSNGSPPFFSRSQESRLGLCRAPRFHQGACSCPHGVFVWRSEESTRPSPLQDSETLLQQSPLAAWLSREEDELSETGPDGTLTGRAGPPFILELALLCQAPHRLHETTRTGPGGS
jgi:hypothetical protein